MEVEKSNPIVELSEKPGTRFVGRALAAREIKIRNKSRMAYDFAALDGNANCTTKDGGLKRNVDVAEGDTVTLFGTKAIDDAMASVKEGTKVEFVFNRKVTTARGFTFNDITVTPLEG